MGTLHDFLSSPAPRAAAQRPRVRTMPAAFLDAPFGGRGRNLRERLGPGAATALAGIGVPRSATPSVVPPDVYASLFSAIAPAA